MTLVVDASVALKWVLAEEGTTEAVALLDGGERLVAPALLYVECANSLWSKARSKFLSASDAGIALTKIVGTPVRIVADDEHVRAAHAIAVEIDRTVYDSLYLAVAIAEGAVLITADVRFAKAVERHAAYGSRIRRLV